MKTQFWTRKGYIGLLMTLVLMFGVQGVADAADLPLRKTSGDLQTRSVTDGPFEISFTVGTRSNTTAIKNAMNRLVSETGTLIDSSGYPVFYATNGTAYRTLQNQPSDTLYRAEVGPEKEAGEDPQNNWIEATGTYYVSSSRYVYDSAGRALYTNQGLSTQSRVLETDVSNTVGSDAQYHYNEEKIIIEVGKDDTALTPATINSTIMRFKLKASGFQRGIIDLDEDPVSDPNGLPRSVTLICTPSGDTDAAKVGTYKIRITDDTPVADTPWTTAPSPRASIDFTLYVVDDRVTVTGIAVSDDDIFSPNEIEQIDNLFTLLPADSAPQTVPIQYTVISGPGTVFERTSDGDETPPSKYLVRSKQSQVFLNLKNGNSVVRVTVSGQDPNKKGEKITFTYTGSGAPTGDSDSDTRDPAPTNTISVSDTSISGAPGSAQDITVGAGTATVRVQGSSGFTSAGGAVSGSGTVRTITLPRTAANYILTVSASGYTDRQISVTVEAPQALGTLTVSKDGAQTGLQQQILVRASSAPSRTVAFTVTRGGVRVGSGEILTTGSGRAIVSVPATGTYILTVSATGYTSRQVTFTAGATTTTTTDTTPDPTTPTTPTTTTPTVSEPSSLQVAGQSTRSGTANTALDAPLLVRVLDDDGDAVAETRVIFRVRTGQGRLSERGNGRAIALQTDNSGYARAPYTPISASSTVEAEASGVTRRVTFTITASGGAATPTTRDTDTGSDTISPVVHTAAAKRPPMLWVDNGAIYALVDTDVRRFAPTVDNALSLAIGGDTVYWTEKTGDSAGTINSANLDGTGIKELKAIMAVPMGITVDTTANLLYWTNSRGRIQSLNADGSGRVENVLQNLTSPLDIGLAGGNVYWTHSNGGIGFASLKGQKQVRNISNGADAAGSLVIGGGKVYWTEETGENGGRIKSANLNGSGITDVASIFAVPIGIGLDSSRGKLFWTNSRGRIQSSDLEGNGVSNVVDGLGSPGDMVLSNSIAAPAATTPTTTTTTADNAKYDVNGDGTVDNMDAGLVSEAMGTSNAKYDVNNDGTVNFLDLLLVFDNRDEGAASAPTVLGMQLTAVQIDVIEEQIDLLIATGDRSPAAMRTLIYLQQLIATARPEQTQLLANYPNPFNPETWIPYELATDTTVTLTIYNAQGVVVRTLQLGHQSAGYYVGRDRAAYWDGRNAFGEQVASGIYFYQLETDAMSLMRKMVILK